MPILSFWLSASYWVGYGSSEFNPVGDHITGCSDKHVGLCTHATSISQCRAKTEFNCLGNSFIIFNLAIFSDNLYVCIDVFNTTNLKQSIIKLEWLHA